MSVNLAPLYGSIGGFSNGNSLSEARQLIDSSTCCFNSYSYIGTPPYPGFIIIDLGADRLITGFKLWGYSCGIGPKPGVTTIPATKGVKNYRVGLLANASSGSAFTIVVSSSVPFSTILDGIVYTIGSDTTNIAPTEARWVKLYVDSNWGNSNELFAAEFEINGETTVVNSTTITSNAKISNDYLRSNAYIYKQIDTVRSTINSDAQIIRFDPGAQKFSDAFIVYVNINSDAHIQANEVFTILSDTFVYRTKNYPQSMITSGKSDTHDSSTRNVIVYNTRFSTSDETIVNDIITSGDTLDTVLDLSVLNLPLGYQNYDWAYDWVVRTYNNAQYKFETRSANTLAELKTLVFSRITQGQLILRGSVNKYHQWRCHVWASGSGDFELHQFTVKAYVDYTSNPLYRALRNKEFTTVSTIIRQLQLPYEPVDNQLSLESYAPGDVNGDKIINSSDVTYLTNYLTNGTPVPSPLISADVNGDGVINALDITTLNDYLTNHGSLPKKRIL